MGTGYTRTDTINNIADGNIINASDFDGEYDAIEAAFNSSSGHTHDGTSSEGGPITVLGPSQDFVASTTEIKPKTNNTLDIGTTGLKFKDMHLAGTANLVNVTTTGDVTLTGAANNVVFDASDNALEFADSAKATFGDAADLQIFHDASNSIIRDTGTGKLALDGSTVEIRKNDGTEVMAQFVEDGAVSLYHDDSVKLATSATGITVTGSIAMDGLTLGYGNGEKGSTQDELYHDGTDSIIENNTGELFIQGNNITLRSDTSTETFIAMDKDGAVELYYDNSKKLDTDSAGINVTGQIDVSTNVNITGDLDVGDDVTLSSDSAVINLGNDSDVTLTHEADTGIKAKAANGFELNLQTGHTSVESGDVLGKITFNAPDEAAGTDALLDGATIEAVAEATFATDNNSTALVFKTNTSAAATERMRIKSDGTIQMDTQVDIDNITIDGNTISSTDTNGNIVLTPHGTGIVDINGGGVDIDGGAIDGVTLGTNSAVTELQVDNININGNAITSTDSNGNIALTPAGTGEVDISKVDIADGEIDGTVIGANSAAAGTFAALQGTTVTASTNLTLASGATVTAILDEDDFSSDSATALATQQSIKAYITNNISSVTPTSTTTFTNKSLTAPVLTGSSSSAGSIIFKEDTDNGTNAVTLIGAADTADVTVTLPAVTGTIITTGNLTDFDVNSIAALSDPIANNDEILIHDTSGSVRKKATFTQIQTNLTSAGFSKDDPTALAIALG